MLNHLTIFAALVFLTGCSNIDAFDEAIFNPGPPIDEDGQGPPDGLMEEPERLCLADATCAQFERCINGRCVSEPEACEEDSDCGTGRFCVDGSCGVYFFDLECEEDEHCIEPGACESTEGAVCASGRCVYLHVEDEPGCDPCTDVICEALDGGCLVGQCVGDRFVAQCRYTRQQDGEVCEVEGEGGVCQKGQCRLDGGPIECEDHNPCTVGVIEDNACVFEALDEGECFNEDGREGVCEAGFCAANPP